jgi:adenylate cyclase
MTLETKLKLQNIFLIIGISLVFGVFYNYFFYPHTITEFLEASVIGLLMGLIIGILEEFTLKVFYQKKSIFQVTVIRAVLYSLLISVILCLVLSIEDSFIKQISYSSAVFQYLGSSLFQRDFLFSLNFIVIILFIVQIIQLIGKANFFRLMFGLYHKPREVSRIFMFLDIKDSTAIAERLTHSEYSTLIKDFFYDISDAIVMFNGQIYQYAGDEIIVTWPIRKKNINCIKAFFKIQEIINKKSTKYLEKFGFVPEFKAGIHSGQVMMTTVGKHKIEIAYHGDVMNTTARIEGKCNELQQQLLISKSMLPFIKDEGFILEEKGEIELKGKLAKLSLYGVNKS